MTEEPKQNRQGITSDIPSDKDKHAQLVKEIAAQLNFDAVRLKEDKPKIKNRCRTCAAFHTPFCTWEYTNFEDEETKRALHIDADAYACSLYFPRPRVETEGEKKFLKKVEQLE
jgi:hypothetical protein